MRIEQKFKQLKKQRKTAFMPFIVAGDPDFKISVEIVKTLVDFSDLLEVGFPYSDPLADGPTIQAADRRALKAGMNTDRVFEFIKRVRGYTEIPITVLVYANLVCQRGIGRFYRQAKEAGVDGILIPDVPVEESGPFVATAKKIGIDQIFLVTQTTTSKRFKKILQHAKGYLYLVSVLGITGARAKIRPEILQLIKRTKTHTSLPLAVGFGISKRSHVVSLKQAGASGYIVGSALVKIIEENLGHSKELKNELRKCIRDLTGRH